MLMIWYLPLLKLFLNFAEMNKLDSTGREQRKRRQKFWNSLLRLGKDPPNCRNTN